LLVTLFSIHSWAQAPQQSPPRNGEEIASDLKLTPTISGKRRSESPKILAHFSAPPQFILKPPDNSPHGPQFKDRRRPPQSNQAFLVYSRKAGKGGWRQTGRSPVLTNCLASPRCVTWWAVFTATTRRNRAVQYAQRYQKTSRLSPVCTMNLRFYSIFETLPFTNVILKSLYT
jgi:hypothetical protein